MFVSHRWTHLTDTLQLVHSLSVSDEEKIPSLLVDVPEEARSSWRGSGVMLLDGSLSQV